MRANKPSHGWAWEFDGWLEWMLLLISMITRYGHAKVNMPNKQTHTFMQTQTHMHQTAARYPFGKFAWYVCERYYKWLFVPIIRATDLKWNENILHIRILTMCVCAITVPLNNNTSLRTNKKPPSIQTVENGGASTHMHI